jgi:ESS family glutamate:Na+ symporter
VCLLYVGRRLLPHKYWFELGIINYGMSTGTTATGLVLLRIIDKDLSSGAAEDYALAAPLSSPFVGGGIITLSLPFLLERVYIGIPVAVLCAGVAGLSLAEVNQDRK